MKRLSHGSFLLEEGPAPAQPADHPNGNQAIPCPQQSNFHYLFNDLQNSPESRLPDVDKAGVAMAETLMRLGDSMTDPESVGLGAANAELDSRIPSIYTYFGQFITHEVVFNIADKSTKLGRDTVPLAKEEIPKLANGRTALLDLDSLYGPILQYQNKCFPVPKDNAEMVLGNAPGCPIGTDVKRQQHDPLFTAIIGDGRNDANLITSQMHLAFLRAHNKLVEGGRSFESAQKSLRQHFQWLVVHDYLPKVVDDKVLKSVLDRKINIFQPRGDQPFMPVEFSAGAFRFGHSMARSRYHYNKTYDKQRLGDLFLPKKDGYAPVTGEWIIDWSQFLLGGQNVARRIDTRLVQPQFARLIDEKGERVRDSQDNFISLAALDLLRGYSLRLPTGQTVAKALDVPPMSAPKIESIAAQVSQEQQAILSQSGLSSATPLWFYVLAEAAALGNEGRLGPVGSIIVAAVLIGLVRCSTDSILGEPDAPEWTPEIGNGNFNIGELLKFAGVLDSQ